MNRVKTIALWALLCAGPAGAHEPNAASSDYETVSEAQRGIYLNAAPFDRATFAKGDILIDVPVTWQKAATVTQRLVVHAGAASTIYDADVPLQAVTLRKPGTVSLIPAYCSPRTGHQYHVNGAKFLGLQDPRRYRADTEQFCLLDADDDGIAEQSVLIHDGVLPIRAPTDIAPTRLVRRMRLPVASGAHAQFSLSDIRASGSKVTVTGVIIDESRPEGVPPASSSVTVSLKKTPTPWTLELFGSRFEILGVDAARQTADIRRAANVDTDAFVATPDVTEFIIHVQMVYY